MMISIMAMITLIKMLMAVVVMITTVMTTGLQHFKQHGSKDEI